MEKRNNKDIRYFVDTTGEMLISIDGKNSLIIDLDGEISYVYDINKTLPLFDRCLSEINKSTLSDKFIGKMMCAATENEQGSSENKEISSAAYLITKDLIDCKSGQKWYREKLPRSVKISVCERLEKLRLDVKNIVDEANDKAHVITDNIVNECMRELAIKKVFPDGQQIDSIEVKNVKEKIKDDIEKLIMDIVITEDNRKKMHKYEKEIDQLLAFLESQYFE